MIRGTTAVALCLVFGFVGTPGAQAPAASSRALSLRLTEYQVRSAARAAVAAAGDDYTVFFPSFVRELKALSPDFSEELPPAVCTSDLIDVSISGPIDAFGWSMREAVRRMEPAEDVPWPAGVVITVSPNDPAAPDIDKVVVMRDGRIVPPLSSALRPVNMRSSSGAPFSIHAGRVIYPVNAFDPGTDVTVIAIPVTGDNCRRVYRDADLRKIF